MIKKTSETTPVMGSVLNTYSDSTLNTYSCDYLNPTITTDTNTTYTISNLTGNKVYKLGQLTALTITACETFDIESIIYFSSGSTATTLTVPNDVTEIGDTTIHANKSYIISVLNKIAVIKEY